MPVMTPLKGRSLSRAQEAMKLETELWDGASLLTKENPRESGFIPGKSSVSGAESSHMIGTHTYPHLHYLSHTASLPSC